LGGRTKTLAPSVPQSPKAWGSMTPTVHQIEDGGKTHFTHHLVFASRGGHGKMGGPDSKSLFSRKNLSTDKRKHPGIGRRKVKLIGEAFARKKIPPGSRIFCRVEAQRGRSATPRKGKRGLPRDNPDEIKPPSKGGPGAMNSTEMQGASRKFVPSQFPGTVRAQTVHKAKGKGGK